MRKFWAVVKREYLKLVMSRAFIIGTLVAPVLSIGFAVVPALIFSIEGEATKIAIVDNGGKVGAAFENVINADKKADKAQREAMRGMTDSQTEQVQNAAKRVNAKFIVENINAENRPIPEIRNELNVRLREGKLDSYVIVPSNIEEGNFEYYARNTSDFVAQTRVERSLNEAVRAVRLGNANISQTKLDEINREITFNSTRVSEDDESEDSGDSFIGIFIVGLLIYVVLLIYGQQILAAVVEEKETRIAEILFSSASPFQLMMGKLVGVGLVAFTQLAIWVASGAAIVIFGFAAARARGIDIPAPNFSPTFVALLFVYFLLGFFTYATLYALIGSMVTTVQEGGQLSFPIILLLVLALYSAFPVIRSPNSNFAVWLSVLPFVSPIVMPVRLAIQTPPLWQIALSILSSLATIGVLTWVAGRAYRVGMLMYGKKATIAEMFKWIRQA
ncbi:MAG: ABC transporter permease [Pyrinomonadaceae bacterium]|nr:ABC transporter permease [Pyrinomonadaceae bacterium]